MVDAISEIGQQYAPLEVGGIILGYESEGQIVIERLCLPGPNSEHSVDRYKHDYDHDLKLIELAHRQSNGVTHYIGDWHTHPNTDVPYLSSVDRRMIKRALKSRNSNLHSHISVVISLKDDRSTFKAWKSNIRSMLILSESVVTVPLNIKIF